MDYTLGVINHIILNLILVLEFVPLHNEFIPGSILTRLKYIGIGQVTDPLNKLT